MRTLLLVLTVHTATCLVCQQAFGQFLTSSKYTNRIERHLADGKYDGILFEGFEAAGARGLTINNAGNLLLGSYDNSTISEIRMDGSVVRSFNVASEYLFGLAYDPFTGDIFALVENEIRRYDSQGEFIATYFDEYFDNHIVYHSGKLYVVAAENSVLQCDTNLDNFTTYITYPGSVFSGMAFDSQGLLYIGDSVNRNIHVFDQTGELIRTFGDSTIDAESSLFLDEASNQIFATNFEQGRVYGFDLTTGDPTISFETSGGVGGTWGVIGISAVPEPSSFLAHVGAFLAVAFRRNRRLHPSSGLAGLEPRL